MEGHKAGKIRQEGGKDEAGMKDNDLSRPYTAGSLRQEGLENKARIRRGRTMQEGGKDKAGAGRIRLELMT
jgi:hypothetical protein